MQTFTGHDHTWDLFLKHDPQEICKRSGVSFDFDSQIYTVKSFGQDIAVSLPEKRVFGQGKISDFLINRSGHFFDLATLWYLISAQNIPLSNELIKPASVKGGQIFVTGTHVLPLNDMANKYGTDPNGFIHRGRKLGGELLEHGDAAIRLYPFPRLPVTLILWVGDEEFPAQLNFFFDATCDQHLPTDVLWSTAMVTVLAMMQ